MNDTAVDFSSVETAITSKRSYTIQPGTILDRAFFEWCQKPEFGLVEIMALFPRNRELKLKLRFQCEFSCPECGKWRWERIGRGKIHLLISHLKFPKRYPFQLDCDTCTERKEEERARIDPEASIRAAMKRLAETGRL